MKILEDNEKYFSMSLNDMSPLAIFMSMKHSTNFIFLHKNEYKFHLFEKYIRNDLFDYLLQKYPFLQRFTLDTIVNNRIKKDNCGSLSLILSSIDLRIRELYHPILMFAVKRTIEFNTSENKEVSDKHQKYFCQVNSANALSYLIHKPYFDLLFAKMVEKNHEWFDESDFVYFMTKLTEEKNEMSFISQLGNFYREKRDSLKTRNPDSDIDYDTIFDNLIQNDLTQLTENGNYRINKDLSDLFEYFLGNENPMTPYVKLKDIKTRLNNLEILQESTYNRYNETHNNSLNELGEKIMNLIERMECDLQELMETSSDFRFHIKNNIYYALDTIYQKYNDEINSITSNDFERNDLKELLYEQLIAEL